MFVTSGADGVNPGQFRGFREFTEVPQGSSVKKKISVIGGYQ